MSDLENLVPPPELCKLIPDGEFADSVLVWSFSCDKRIKEPFVDERDCVEHCRRNMVNAPPSYPAPTTDEILDKCKDIIGALNPTLWYQHEWIADCAFDRTGKLSAELFKDDDFKNLDIIEGRDKSPMIAAMKLWLKLKGIKYAE